MQTDAANPKRYRIQATFYVDPTWGPVCERKIGPGAGDDTVIERVTAEHIAAHPAEHAAFLASRANVAPVGIALKRGLGLDDGVVRLLNTHGVMDVETLATVPDSRIVTLMPGNPELGMEIRDRARLMVPEERRTPLAAAVALPGPASRQAAVLEIEQLKQRLALAEADRDRLSDIVESMTPPMEAADEPEDLAGEAAAEAALGGAGRRGRAARQAA